MIAWTLIQPAGMHGQSPIKNRPDFIHDPTLAAAISAVSTLGKHAAWQA